MPKNKQRSASEEARLASTSSSNCSVPPSPSSVDGGGGGGAGGSGSPRVGGKVGGAAKHVGRSQSVRTKSSSNRVSFVTMT